MKTKEHGVKLFSAVKIYLKSVIKNHNEINDFNIIGESIDR